MNFTVFAVLLLFSAALIFAGAFRTDKYLYYGAGVILLLLSSGLFISGLEYSSGVDIVENKIDSNTTEIYKNTTYTAVSESHGADFIVPGLGLTLTALAFYLLVHGTIIGNDSDSLFSSKRR